MPDAPPKPPSPKALLGSLKGHPKQVYLIVGGAGVIGAVYLHHRSSVQAQLANQGPGMATAPDSSSVPVDTTQSYAPGSIAPDPTQGAYYGSNTPPDFSGVETAIAGLGQQIAGMAPPDPAALGAAIAAGMNQSGQSAGGTGPGANPYSVNPGTYYDPTTHQTFTVAAPAVTGGGPPPAPGTGTHQPPSGGGAVTTNPKTEKRYVVKKKPFGHAKKLYVFHEYESAPGKADWGKGGEVNMGPA